MELKSEFNDLVAIAKRKYIEQNIPLNKWVDESQRTTTLFNHYYNQFLQLSPFVSVNSSVCDLGTGPGYTLWFLKRLKQCDVYGIDKPNRTYVDADFELIRKVMELDHCVDGNNTIKPFQSIILPKRRFDLIISFNISFDFIDLNTRWQEPEWKFFFEDISNYLKDSGRLILLPNSMKLSTWDISNEKMRLEKEIGKLKVYRNNFYSSVAQW